MSFSIFVNKEHVDAEKLAQEAGVSLDQLDTPVFVYYRDHHLVNRHELDEAFDGSPGYEPLASGPPYSEQKFIADRSWWHEKWTGQLRTPIKWNSDGTPAREEKSMIALSTGPHWSLRELWPKGSEAHQDSNDHILRGYQGAVSRFSIICFSHTNDKTLFCPAVSESLAKYHRSRKGTPSSRLVEKQYARTHRLLAI